MNWDDDLDIEDEPVAQIDPADANKDDKAPDDWDASDDETPAQPEPVKPAESKPTEDDPANWAESSDDDEPPPPKPSKRVETSDTEETEEEDSGQNLRSPICVIMGHVDTGKTSLLDKIRRTNVQDGEAGGITQQIGASYFPSSTLQQQTRSFVKKYNLEYKLPGLLIIDTPGHESFTNLRSRGSSLCDCAILVVDILGGLEKQTLESIELLRAKKTPFIVALNKIDTCTQDYVKPKRPYATFEEAFKGQSKFWQQNFMKRLGDIISAFHGNGQNTQIYTKLKFGPGEKLTDIPIIPTCARNGEGIPDLLLCLQLMTQYKMADKITLKKHLQCSVLEVKKEEGIGTTLDVILVNGALRVNDQIVLAGLNGPICTKIRALLTPAPLRELRVKSEWIHHNVVHAAMGLKISAPDLEGAVAGSELFVAKNDDEIDEYMERCEQDVTTIFDSVDKTCNGVMVKASTLGALEALISYLKDHKLDVSIVGIGPVHRSDVQLIQPMVEKCKKCAVILAFNVPVSPDAAKYARDNGIQIYTAEIIYHLTDQYDQYLADMARREKDDARKKIVYPVELKFLPDSTFNRTRPVIIGVRVLRGTLRRGTPLCIAQPEGRPLFVGTVDTIKLDDRDADLARVGSEVSINLRNPPDRIMVAGKDLKSGDVLMSRINREIIDLLKQYFRDELTDNDWTLIRDLKKPFDIK